MNYTQCGSALALPYADGIAQTCVTSPPYYGLRRYLQEGDPNAALEVGTEQTPAAYVAQIVAAMREVWRVLRDDGTLWLNLGSSFSSASSGRSQSPSPSRVPAYGSGGTGLPDSQGLGSAYSGLCDEHLADFRTHLGRISDTYRQTPQEQRPRWLKDHDIELPGFAGAFQDALPLSVLASTTLESWRRLRGECSRCASREDALSGFGSYDLSEPGSARNLAGMNGKGRTSQTSGGRISDREPLDLAWGDYTSTIKAKDLLPIPWMVAMALQADGWYLRRDIIWAKKNCMPESVTDRPTSSHEYVFLLAKQPRYFYDAEAIAEPSGGANGSSFVSEYDRETKPGLGMGERKESATRNARSVWQIATQPYSGAHFATMPPELARRCILAGTSARGQCPKCGAPWTRVVERTQKGPRFVKEATGWEPGCGCDAAGATFEPDDFQVVESPTGERAGDDPSLETGRAGMNRPRGENEGVRRVTRYQQRRYASQLRESPHREAMEADAGEAFAHYIRVDRSGARPIPPALLGQWVDRGWLTPVAPPVLTPYDPVPQIVLDPFAGSGTTAMCALQAGRRAIGTELNPKYLRLQDDRTQVTMGLGL